MCSYCTVSPLSTAAVSHIHSLCAASVSPLSSATVSVSPYIWPNPPIWLHTPSDTMCVCVLCVCGVCVCVCIVCVCVVCVLCVCVCVYCVCVCVVGYF